MASLHLSLFLIATIASTCLAQAPAPAPAGKVNLTAILEKAGQFTTFIRLLASTQVGTQVDSQVKSSSEGMTVFAPTDNAFQNLKAGTINDLTTQQQIQLIQNHVLPKYYSMDQFQTISNPVRTQATDQEGGVFGLNITSTGNNQFNVSCNDVQTTVNNALRQRFPLAVYQVDKVLMPKFGSRDSKAESPSPAKAKGSSSAAEAKGAEAPAVDEAKNGGFGVRSMGMGMGMVVGVGLVTMGLLS